MSAAACVLSDMSSLTADEWSSVSSSFVLVFISRLAAGTDAALLCTLLIVGYGSVKLGIHNAEYFFHFLG